MSLSKNSALEFLIKYETGTSFCPGLCGFFTFKRRNCAVLYLWMREQCENDPTLTMVGALTIRVSAALQENIEFSFLIFQC